MFEGKDHDEHEVRKPDDDRPEKKHDGDENEDGHRRHIIHPRPTHGEPAVRERLNKSIAAMTREFPELSYREISARDNVSGVWSGRVQPFKNTESVAKVLDDLTNDRPVQQIGGTIHHLDECSQPHNEDRWEKIGPRLVRQFEILITYAGGMVVPRCYVISPAIAAEKRMHMWADGAICAFLASESVWRWQRDTVADFIPHALIWLIKWSVFDETGTWIGSQHQSSANYHLRIVGSNDPCWCGSGRCYRKCCKHQDEISVGLMPAKRLLRATAARVPWVRRW